MPSRYRTWRNRATALYEQRELVDESDRHARREYLDQLRVEANRQLPGRAGFAGWLRRRLVVPGTVVSERISVDDVGTHSGALTYAAIIAVPPLMLFTLSIASFVLKGNEADLQKLVDGISGLFPGGLDASIDSFLTDQLHTAMNARVSVGLIGLVGLLWTASSLASRLRHALGQIFGTKRTGVLTGRPAGMIIGVLTIVAIIGVAILSAVKEWVHGLLGGSIAGTAASELAIAVGTFAFFLALYRLLTPGEGPTMLGHVPGTIVFVVAWAALQAVGGLYFSKVVAESTALYGTVGALFGIVAFLYATAWLVLLGAEINAERWDAERAQVR